MRGERAQAGFTYIGILIAVALMGLALAAAGSEWRFVAQRDKEQELLYIGHEYRNAIARYRTAGGGGTAFPLRLEDLVTDERGPTPRHFLRKLYADPFTARADWEIIQSADGQIIGIASTAKGVPLKQDNFDPADEAFKAAQCYCDWKFVFTPRRFGPQRKTINPNP